MEVDLSKFETVEKWDRKTIESLIPKYGGKHIAVTGHSILGAHEDQLKLQEIIEPFKGKYFIIFEYIPLKPFPHPDITPSMLILFEPDFDWSFYGEDHDNDGHDQSVYLDNEGNENA
jgi:hypothetical protein